MLDVADRVACVDHEYRAGEELQLLDKNPVTGCEGALLVVGESFYPVDARCPAPAALGKGEVHAYGEKHDVFREVRRFLIEPACLCVADRGVQRGNGADNLN